MGARARERFLIVLHIPVARREFLAVTLDGPLFKREAPCSLQLIQSDAPVSSFKAQTCQTSEIIRDQHMYGSTEGSPIISGFVLLSVIQIFVLFLVFV